MEFSDIEFPEIEWKPWQPVSRPELIAWTVFYVFTLWMYRPLGTHYLDAVHMITHEAGHPLFSYTHNLTLTVAGGTLLELFIPAALAWAFVVRGHTTGTAFCAFMFFNAFIGIGIYMADARAKVLPLVSLGASSDEEIGHDWEYLFEQSQLLRHDIQIGNFTRMIGYLGMAATIAWLAWMKKRLDDERAVPE